MPRRVIHYLHESTRPHRTPCGIFVLDIKPVHAPRIPKSQLPLKTSDDMDRVTCKRCLASWAKHVREGP